MPTRSVRGLSQFTDKTWAPRSSKTRQPPSDSTGLWTRLPGLPALSTLRSGVRSDQKARVPFPALSLTSCVASGQWLTSLSLGPSATTQNAYGTVTGSRRDRARRSKHNEPVTVLSSQARTCLHYRRSSRGLAEGNGALGGALGSLRIQGQWSPCLIPGKLSVFFFF